MKSVFTSEVLLVKAGNHVLGATLKQMGGNYARAIQVRDIRQLAAAIVQT